MKSIEQDSCIPILIADDNYRDAGFVKKEIKNTFKSSFFKCIDSNDKLLSELISFRPDIIISEYDRPNISALAVLKTIEENSHKIPLIVLTTEDNENNAPEFVKNGATDYAIKGQTNRVICSLINAYGLKTNCLELEHAEFDIAEFKKDIKKYRKWESSRRSAILCILYRLDQAGAG